MLSHLRFHRRAPSNSVSPLAEHAAAWDAAAQREHPLPPREVSPRPDARPRSPSSSHLPPKLPPIARVASTGSEELFVPRDDAPPGSQEARQLSARPTPDEQNKPGFIGGVALEKYRRAAQEQVPDAVKAMTGPPPDTQLSRAKPPPPPINTGLAAGSAVPGNKQAKSSWFSTPSDFQGSAVSGKRPTAPRQGNDTAPAPASEPPKGKKGLPFLKNPVSSLLMRRKTALAATDTQPLAPSYDPRIKGTRVHDFSAPRPRKAVLNADSASARDQEGASAVAGLGDQSEPTTSHLVREGSLSLSTEHSGHAKDGASSRSADDADHTQRGPSTSTLLAGQPALTPSHDGHSLHASSSIASRDTQVAPLPPATSASVRTTASRQLSVSATSVRDSVASAIPRHMKSTSSRFSFDMIGAAEQEKLLEERHRQREHEKKLSDDPADGDARFDDFDEDFDYDAMMDDDGLEEPIPGVNADYDYDYDYEDDEDQEAAMDPDNDQENFAGFVFQRSDPASSLVSPHTPGMVPTPRDASGKVIGFAMTKDTTPATDSPLSPAPLMLHKNDHLALDYNVEETTPQERPCRSSFPSATDDTQSPPRADTDDIYFDDGLADELDFEHDGTVFDESIFDNNDTDQYGRPIPGAFALAKEAMQAAQQQQPSKRDSDMTSSASRQSGQSCAVQSTAHTSITVGQHPSGLRADGSLKPPAESLVGVGQDLAYQAALAEAAQKAAASGKFRRSSSPEVLAGLADPPPDNTDLQDPDTNEHLDDYDNDGFTKDFDDFDFDDEAIIAEANASALANDCDGFYGQEFGFYSAPVPHHHPHPIQSFASSPGGGVLTSENLFQYANGGYFGPASAAGLLNRSMSGRAAVREPNLTPITERSEYSNRNSVMSFTLPPAIGGSDTGGRNSSLSMAAASASPGLAQLALLPHDSDEWESMSLAGLMKLRSKAWGGSQGSLVTSTAGGGGGAGGGAGGFSSREGSPRSERAVPVAGMDGAGAGSPYGAVGVPAHLGHARVGSGLSLWSFSEEAGEDWGGYGGGGGGERGSASPVAGLASGGLAMSTVLPPRPGSAGAVVNGAGGTSVHGNGVVVSPLPQRPQSLFIPPQAPLPAPSPGSGQVGGSVCSPVLEGEEHEDEAADGFRLAPALPVMPSGSAEVRG
ncbi:hypothetical protein N657DRAFT_647382 [Parathielavia appendiculata]|uniref:Uncharacterized protein n=1 Tax=Parathielavia appendiculata TaxID=2587402 RepID=A0AAN6Z1V0_9PEZI|nr:hypothetical protein N657DRAFT_647382 [Parathielavia appendiculata]